VERRRGRHPGKGLAGRTSGGNWEIGGAETTQAATSCYKYVAFTSSVGGYCQGLLFVKWVRRLRTCVLLHLQGSAEFLISS
jgi:hypothetical protein